MTLIFSCGEKEDKNNTDNQKDNKSEKGCEKGAKWDPLLPASWSSKMHPKICAKPMPNKHYRQRDPT